MTGYARVEDSADGTKWSWEVKSVNNKGLDVRFRLPEPFYHLDIDLQKKVSAQLARGTVYCTLNLDEGDSVRSLKIKKDYMYQLLGLRDELKGMIVDAPITLDAVLMAKDLMLEETVDTDYGNLAKAIEKSLMATVKKLMEMRQKEGAQMKKVLSGFIEDVEKLIKDARKLSATKPKAIHDKLHTQIKDLLGDQPVDETRLTQEIAIMTSKADIREELDRLESHLAHCKDLLEKGGPVGRKLDFMSQELNREANTVCSKSQDVTLTNIGVAIKHAIEQFREQVQNIE